MNADSNSMTSLASKWILRSFKVIVGVGVALVIIQIITTIWLKSFLNDSADELIKATGMSSAIAAWLKGITITVVAISLAPWFLRLCVGLTLPGFSSIKTMRLSMLAIAISGVAVCTPPAIRACRGLGPDGIPSTMQSVDPNTSCWFTPDGKPHIAVSYERDGSSHFWNRPGITPQSGIPAVWVTVQARSAWEAQQAVERSNKARAEENSRKADEARKQSEVKAQNVRDVSRREITQNGPINEGSTTTGHSQPARNALHQFPWESRRILPGKFLYVWDFPGPTLEVELPVDSIIEVKGYRPFLYQAGVARIAMQGSNGFRISSRARTPFEIRIRALASR